VLAANYDPAGHDRRSKPWRLTLAVPGDRSNNGLTCPPAYTTDADRIGAIATYLPG